MGVANREARPICDWRRVGARDSSASGTTSIGFRDDVWGVREEPMNCTDPFGTRLPQLSTPVALPRRSTHEDCDSMSQVATPQKSRLHHAIASSTMIQQMHKER